MNKTYRMTRFSPAFHSHARQLSRSCNIALSPTLDCMCSYLFARIAQLFHCLNFPENKAPLQNSVFAEYSAFHVAIYGIKTVDFVIVIGLEALVPVRRTFHFSQDTIFSFSQDLFVNIRGTFPPSNHICSQSKRSRP